MLGRLAIFVSMNNGNTDYFWQNAILTISDWYPYFNSASADLPGEMDHVIHILGSPF